MLFLHNPQATQDALDILRSGDLFDLSIIFMIVVVLYIYFNELYITTNLQRSFPNFSY